MKAAHLAIFGGSLDPFHKGHEAILKAALQSFSFKRLLLIPTANPAYKTRRLSPATYRFAMAELAAEAFPRVKVERYELAHPERHAYTSDTVQAMSAKYQKKWGKTPLVELIYGSDALDYLETWHEPEKILGQARLWIALRGDDAEEAAVYRQKAAALTDRFGGRIRFFPMPRVDLSSTRLRADLRRGEVDSKAFPKAIGRFLEDNQIYRFAGSMEKIADASWALFCQYEQAIWSRLSEPRRIHSLNVAQYAVHLADIHGESREKAALAGLLHDMCKYDPLPEQLAAAAQDGFSGPVNGSIAHGPAAAYELRNQWDMQDEAILSAIRYHTTLHAPFSPLDAILYLSDKIEWGRTYTDVTPIRELAEKDLRAATKLCLEAAAAAILRQGKAVHPFTQAALRSLSD